MLSDLPAEKGVLAGIFQYGITCYNDVSDIITANTFTFESNQLIYRCFEYLIRDKELQQLDYPSILSAAADLGFSTVLNKKDEIAYLRGLCNFPVNKDNIRRLAGKIRKLEVARQLSIEIDAIKSNLVSVTGDEKIDDILNLAENPIHDFSGRLGDSQGEGPQLIGKNIDDYLKNIIENPRDMVGISTGYPIYDMAIGGGLRRKTVNIIGARPKIGKTLLADNIALHIAGKTGIPVLNLDTEMSKEDHWNRMIANLSDVTINEIENGKFVDNTLKFEKVKAAVDKLRSIPYYYKSIAGQRFEETIALMRRWVTKTVGFEESGEAKPCVIIYDYLKLMDSEGLKNLQEYQALGFQMTGLHNFMVRYSVPCLAFIQLNRDGITKEDTDVASGSDRVIWLCSNFSIFKKKTDEEIAEDTSDGLKCNRKLVPIIARHGGGLDDGDYINMNSYGQFGRIVEHKTRKDLHNNQKKGEFLNDADNLPKDATQF